MAVLTKETLQQIRAVRDKYPRPRSAILPALHLAQNQIGWISREAMEEVAQALDLNPDEVDEVTSFYTMYYTRPVGRYVLEICKTVPCGIMGADEIIEYTGRKLGIEPGETTPDGMFTLLRVECLAACHRAPMMQVNHRYYQDLTPAKIDAFIQEARALAAEGPGRETPILPGWSETVEIAG